MCMTFIADALAQTWLLLLQSGLYLLGGFIIAGFIHAFLPTAGLSRWLGRDDWRSVLRAAIVGVPLPLCSCSVVPVAAALRRGGASRGATTAFLISTPESGVDSIAATYALLDPVMTVARPASAFLTAFSAGIAENLWGAGSAAPAAPAAARCCAGGARVGGVGLPVVDAVRGGLPAAGPRASRVRRALRYGLVEMFEDLGRFMLVGFLLAGVLAVVLESFLPLRSALGSPWAPLIMLVAGVPVYVCAASATPMIAVLVSQGLSPGAGLVFLLAGPATNAAGIVLLRGLIGARGVAIYVGSIAVCALLAGYAVDALYPLLGATPRALVRAEACHAGASWLDVAGAVALSACVLNGVARRYLSGLRRRWGAGLAQAEAAR